MHFVRQLPGIGAASNPVNVETHMFGGTYKTFPQHNLNQTVCKYIHKPRLKKSEAEDSPT